jgi:hypothetical protein
MIKNKVNGVEYKSLQEGLTLHMPHIVKKLGLRVINEEERDKIIKETKNTKDSFLYLGDGKYSMPYHSLKDVAKLYERAEMSFEVII